MKKNEILEAFLFEANELLENLDKILIECEKNKKVDADSVNNIFRIMHTIKGSSAMMEFESITSVAHKMEDLFAYVRNNGFDSRHNTGLFDLLFKASDYLKAELEKIQENKPLTKNIGKLVDEINNFLKKISSSEASSGNNGMKTTKQSKVKTGKTEKEEADEKPGTEGDFEYYSFRVMFEEEAKMENLRAYMLLSTLQESFPNIRSLPENPQDSQAEEIINNGLTIAFDNQNDMKKARRIAENYSCVSAVEDVVYKIGSSENVAGIITNNKPDTADAKSSAAVSSATSSLINVNLSKLDSLIDLMGEIVITESIVTSIPSRDRFDYDKFMKDARQLQKLTNQLQENIMSIRMIPISNMFNKMNRIVRDMSKKLSKEVDLVLIGEETEVDKQIIDNIADPIMHIVRNAMDHGIETPEVRKANGKPETGKITLKAENTVGEIVITATDDGKGFDKKTILSKAKEKGFLKKPESEYTDKEIFSILLMPGFSTKTEVTEFSGRGVGLDVVKSSIEKIGGSVTLSSKENCGSTVSITIPLTLAIVSGMNVMAGTSIFTVPIHNIRQTFKPEKENIIYDTHGKEMIILRNDCYPVIRLGEKYGIESRYSDLCDGIVLLVEAHGNSYCIFVDSLIGEQQIVIKPLPQYLNYFKIKNQGISGCAILGDGSISIIIDAVMLFNK